MNKRDLHGIDTKASARRVENEVLQKITKRKRRLLFIIPALVVAIAMSFFLYKQMTQPTYLLADTEITDELIVQVGPLTEEDIRLYKSNRVTEEELRADYRVLFFSYHVFKEKGAEVVIDHSTFWPDLMNTIDGVTRYAGGGGWSQNNVSEDFAHDEYRLVIYTKDLTEDKLTQALGDYKLSVTWKNTQGESMTETISLGGYVQFMK